MNIVFIAGIGHSGSTLLNLLLGAQNRALAVGEIDKIICKQSRATYMERYIRREKYPCSCGKYPVECEFWGAFSKYVRQNEDQPYFRHYGKAIELAKNGLDADFLVDASKNIYALKRVVAALDKMEKRADLRVLHLVKDVRNLAVSNIRSGVRESGVLKNFRKWKSQNRKFETFVEEENIPYMHVGYEELAISTEFILNKIAGFIGLQAEQVTTDLNPERSHILFGNNMRLNDKHVSRIEYDYQWFTNSKVAFWYALSPGIQRYNFKWVYSNVADKFKTKNEYVQPTVAGKPANP